MSPDATSATLPRSPLAEKRGKAGPPRGHIAYISHYFPALTQTFVYREVLALEEMGWKVQPFSIRRPTKGISEEANDLAQRTIYVFPVHWRRFVARQILLFLAHPLRYLG